MSSVWLHTLVSSSSPLRWVMCGFPDLRVFSSCFDPLLRCSLQHLCLLQTSFMSLSLNRSFAGLSSLSGVCWADQGESAPFVLPRVFGIPSSSLLDDGADMLRLWRRV